MNFEYFDSFDGNSYNNDKENYNKRNVDKCCFKAIEKAFCCCKWNSDNYNCDHKNNDNKGRDCKDYDGDKNCGCRKHDCWDNTKDDSFDDKKDCTDKRDEGYSSNCRRIHNRCCCRGFRF